MKVLVTGASGFIGSHLYKELSKQGHSVVALVHSLDQSRINQQSLGDNIVSCEISDIKQIHGIFKENTEIDCVFHVAALTVDAGTESPTPHLTNNVHATLNLLECCRLYNVNKFVFSSTWAVYGILPNWREARYLPVDELHPVCPNDYYAVSKVHSETDCKFYHEKYGISSIVLRYSRVYGAGRRRGVLLDFMERALQNKTLRVDGDISLDIVHVHDVVQANILAKQKASGFEIFNIGSGEEVRLYDLALRIRDLIRSSSHIEYKDDRRSRFWYDVSKARRILGFAPQPPEKVLTDYIHSMKM